MQQVANNSSAPYLTHAGRPPVTVQDASPERATVLLLTVGVVVVVAMVTLFVKRVIAGKDLIADWQKFLHVACIHS